MMPRPQSRAQRDAAVANRKKFALAPGDRAAVSNSQLLAQADPASVPSVTVDVAQPQVFSEEQNLSNEINREFFALAPADRAAIYAAAHPVGICCIPRTPAIWSTWNTDWNACDECWSYEVYVV